MLHVSFFVLENFDERYGPVECGLLLLRRVSSRYRVRAHMLEPNLTNRPISVISTESYVAEVPHVDH